MPRKTPYTLDQMVAEIAGGKGFARPNLYLVLVPQVNAQATSRHLSFMCSSVSLPSRQLETVQRQIGPERKDIVYGFANPPVSMNFRVLNDQNSRHFFETWQNSVVTKVNDGFEGDYDIEFPEEYTRPVHIYQLQKGTSFPVFNKNLDLNVGPIDLNFEIDIDAGLLGKSTYHWVLEEAFPVTFQQETLSDGSQGEISEFTIEFSYKRWSGEKIKADRALGVTAQAGVTTNIEEKIGNAVYKALKI